MPEVCEVQMMKNIALSKEILGKEIILWNQLRRLKRKEGNNESRPFSFISFSKQETVCQ
jgi:hypothetical protein